MVSILIFGAIAHEPLCFQCFERREDFWGRQSQVSTHGGKVFMISLVNVRTALKFYHISGVGTIGSQDIFVHHTWSGTLGFSQLVYIFVIVFLRSVGCRSVFPYYSSRE